MAARAASYMKNITKSVGYSAIEVLKDCNPTITSFTSNNSDALKETYNAIAHLDKTIGTFGSDILDSKAGQLGKKAMSNIKEDLRTGKWYNLERKRKDQESAASVMMGGFGDDDFGFEDLANGNFDFDAEMDQEESLESMMDLVGKKSSEAVSQAIVQTTEHSINVQTQLARATAEQNQAIYANLHAGMGTINENLGKLIEFANGPMTTHMENSKTFYDTTTKLAEERNAILKEMLEIQKNVYNKKDKTKNGSNRLTMGDIVDYESGTPDLEAYYERIKQNIQDMSAGTGDMIKQMLENGVLDTMISSPLEGLTKGLVSTVIPNVLKKSMKDFNKTLSGAFSSVMNKMMASDNDNGIFNMIRNIFGIDTTMKSGFNTRDYEKGAVPFDGIVRKSIVEVIPTYLARIESAITKSEERRYDFDEGKFIKASKIKEKMTDMKDRALSSANMDINDYIRNSMEKIYFGQNDKKRKKDLKANIDKIMKKSFETGNLFNPEDLEQDMYHYGLSGDMAADDMELIRTMFKSMPRHLKMRYAQSANEAKESFNRDMKYKEASGHDIMTALFNNSFDDIKDNLTKKKPSKKEQAKMQVSAQAQGSKIILPAHVAREIATQATKKKDSSKKDDDSDPATSEKTEIKEGQFNLENMDTESVQADLIKAFQEANMDEKNKDKKKLSDKLKKSNTIKNLLEGVEKLANKPLSFVTGLIEKADKAVYQLVFGVEYDENGEKKSMAAAIFDGLKDQFKELKKWTYKLFKPIIDPFLKPLANKVKNSSFGQRFSSVFKDLKNDVGDTLKETKDKVQEYAANNPETAIHNYRMACKKKGIEPDAQAEDAIRRGKKAEDVDSRLKGDTDQAAKGMKKVTKTGVVAVSEGEMILPPDMNPYNIAKRETNETRAKKQFTKSLIESIPGFAEGGDVTTGNTLAGEGKVESTGKLTEGLEQVHKELEKRKEEQRKRKIHIIRSKFRQCEINPNVNLDAMFSDKDYADIIEFGLEKEFKKAMRNVNGNRAIQKIQNTASAGIGGIVDSFKRGWNKNKDDNPAPMTKEQKKMVGDAMGEIKRLFPEFLGGGAIGAGVSLITGAIGGPLLGAAAGGAITMMRKSDKFNEAIFGKLGEDGTRDGSGLLSAELSKNFQKYAPRLGKGAILGAITSLIPITPFGPLTGAFLGAAVGFATRNEEIQEALFGDEDGEGGLFKKDFPEKVKKALPAMGIGAAAGLIAGPLGMLPNILLGAAGGFAATTDKFKDFFFGEVGDDDKRHGGLIERAAENIFKPIANFTVDTIKDLTEWADKNIKQPLMDAIDPIKTQFKLIFKSLHDGINKFFEHSLGATFDQLVKDKLLNPIGGFVKKVTGVALAPVKMMVSAPFKAIGAVGNSLRNRQINRGNADYMSADERLAFREKGGLVGKVKRMNPLGAARNSKWNTIDKTLSGMNKNEAGDLASSIQFALDKEKGLEHSTDKAYKNFSKNVRRNKKLNSHQVNMIAKELKKYIKKDKDPQKVKTKLHRYLGNIDGLSDKERQDIVNNVDTFMAEMTEYKDRAEKFSSNKQNIIDLLQKEFNGAKINEKDLPKLMQYLQTEAKTKDAINNAGKENEAPTEKSEQERHNDLMDQLGEINLNLSKLVDPDKSKINKLKDEYGSTFGADAAKGMGMIDAKNRLFHSLTGALSKGIDIGAEGFRILYATAKDNGITGYHSADWKDKINKKKGIKGAGQLAAVSEGEVIVDTDDISEDNIPNFASGGIVGATNNLAGQKYQYHNDGKGHLLRFIMGNDGKPFVDKSDSDTAKAIKENEEDRQEQKSFYNTMIGLPGSLVGKIKSAFFGEEAEKEKKEKKGIFSKILSFLSGGVSGLVNAIPGGSSTLAGAVGLPIAVGAAKNFLDSESGEKLKAKVGEFAKSLGLDEKFDKIVNKLGEVKDGVVNWLAGGPGAFAGGLPGLLQAAVEHWATGFEFIATTIIPKAAEILVSALPDILIGVGKGIAKIISTNFHNIIHGGEGSNDLTQKDSDIDKLSSVKLSGITSANGSHVMVFGNYNKSSNWSGYTSQKNGTAITINTGINKMISGLKTVDPKDKEMKDAIDNANNTYNALSKTGDIKDYRTTDEYKDLSSGMQEKLDSQLADMTKNGENVIRVNMGTEENPDWRYKTIQEVLGRDDINIGSGVDENGNTVNLTGTDLLDNPTLAGSLGLDWQLSNEERQANKEEMGIAKDTSLQHTMMATGTKQFLKGQGGKTILGKVAKGVRKIPFVGPMASAALGVTDNVINGAGKLGNKLMPGWLIGKGGENTVKNGPKHKILSKFLGGLDGSNDIVKVGNIAESGKHYSELSEAFLNNSGQTMTRAEALSKGLSEEAGEFATTNKSKLAGLGEKLGVYKPGKYGTKVAGEAVGEVAEEVAEGSLEAAVKGTAEGQSKGLISKITDWVFKHLKNIADNGFIFNKFGEGLKKAGKACSKEAVDAAIGKLIDVIEKKAMPEFLKKLSKAGAKTLGKIAGKIVSGGIVGLIFSGGAFLSGFRNAETTLGVIADNDIVDYDPSFSTKLISGLCAFINETFFQGLVPLDLLFNILYPLAKELFDIDPKDTEALDKARAESQSKLQEWNMENDTNATIQEFNDKDKITTKFKNGAKDFFFGKENKETGEREGGVVGAIKNGAATVKDFVVGGVNGVKDAGKAVIDWGKNIIETGMDIGKTIGDSVSNAFKYATYQTDKKAADSINVDEKDPMYGFAKFLSGAMDMVFAPTRGVFTVGRGIVNVVKTVADFVSAFGSQIKADAEQGIKDFNEGDFEKYFRFGATEVNAEGEEQRNPLSPMRVAIKTITRTVMLPALAIGWVGKKIGGAIGKVVDGIKSIGSTIVDAGSTSLDLALHGTAQEYLTVVNPNEGDTSFGWLNTVINVGTRAVLSPVFGIAQVGKGIKRGIDTVIDGGKKVLNVISGLARNNIDVAMNGSIFDYFNTSTGTDAGFDNPMGWLQHAMVGISRAVMFPAFAAIQVGKGIKKGVDTIVSAGKTVLNVLSGSVNNTLEIMRTGSISDYFNIYNGEESTQFSWLNYAITGVTRSLMLPVAAVYGAGRIVKSGIDTLVSAGKTVVSSVKSNASTSVELAKKGSLMEYFNFKNGDESTEFGWVNTALTAVTRISMLPYTGAVFIGTKVKSFVSGLISSGKTMATNINKDREYVSGYYDKDNLDGYWTNNNKSSTGVFGVLESVMGTMNRVIHMPFIVIRQALGRIAGLIEKPVDWVKKKLGGLGKAVGDFFGFDSSKNDSGETVGLGDGGSGSGLTKFHARGSGDIPKSDPEFAGDSAFVSQLDSRYANKRFNVAGDSGKQTLADSGCGPAAAAMVVNDAYQNNEVLDMKQASKDALKYKVKDGGVNAAYFEDEFAKHGLATQYMMDDNQVKNNQNIIDNLRQGNRTVLMGADDQNNSKSNSPYGPNDHYIVATRISPDGKYMWVNDPESRTPEVKYPTSTILNNTRMGVAGVAANGSGLLNRIHARGSSAIGSIRSKLKRLHGRGKYGPDTYQYKVWTKLRGAGYNEVATAAAMGNIQHECGFDPNLVEKGSGVGYGLVQWSYGRRTAFENYAASKGVAKSDINIQIEYLLTELAEGSGIWTNASSKYGFGNLTRADWANGTDIEKATKAFMCCFERPSYNPGTNHIDRRIASAKEYLQEFAGIAGDSSSTSSSSGDSSSNSSGSFLDEIFGVFDDLAVGYGLKKKGSSSTSGGTTGGSDKQNALVDKMKSVEGQLAYSQSQRNPDTGSGDCSSTVQWAYQNVLGVDPGSWTGAQETDDDMVTITEGFDNAISDPSKLQPGDLILFRKGGTSTHVEMYAGNNQMIGHGGGADGRKKGPTVKALNTNFGSQAPYMVRRWKGFMSGEGSGLEPDKNVRINDSIRTSVSKHTDNRGFLRKSRFSNDKIKNLKVPAGLYAAGSDMISTSVPGNTSSSVPTVKTVEHDAKMASDKYAVYLAAITKLLAKEVQNTTMLSTIVTILTELVKIVEEESKLKGSATEIEQQRAALQSKRESMMNILSATGVQSSSGMNDEISRLIRETERLARL